MLKLASFAMIAAMGSVGIAQACQTVSVGVGIPVVTIDGEEAFEFFVDEAELERRLDIVGSG